MYLKCLLDYYFQKIFLLLASLILCPEVDHQINNVTRNFPQLFILLVNGIFTLGFFSFLFPSRVIVWVRWGGGNFNHNLIKKENNMFKTWSLIWRENDKAIASLQWAEGQVNPGYNEHKASFIERGKCQPAEMAHNSSLDLPCLSFLFLQLCTKCSHSRASNSDSDFLPLEL